jgi:UDP-N-acetylmuramate--alanine ligase
VRSGTNGITLFEAYDIQVPARYPTQTVQLGLPGKHNIQNALAAVLAVEASFPTTCDPLALATFKPPGRRFELRGDIKGIAVIDDYAHNPMSIRAVLEAARQRYLGREIWAVWQPHTYSRTQALLNAFINSFDHADHVFITDIYAARESPIPGMTSASVVAAMQHPDVRLTPTFADTVAILKAEVTSPAVVLVMSAGDAPQISTDYISYLQTRANAETSQSLE